FKVAEHRHLAVYRRLPRSRLYFGIRAVRLHLTRVDGIAKLQIQDASQLFGDRGIVHPHAYLYAAFGVAGQEVARCDIDAHIVPAAEAVNTGVLQVAPHDTADVHIFGAARHTGPHA